LVGKVVLGAFAVLFFLPVEEFDQPSHTIDIKKGGVTKVRIKIAAEVG